MIRRGLEAGMPGLTPVVGMLMAINVVTLIADVIFDGALSYFTGVSREALLQGYGLGSLRLLSFQFVHAYGAPGHLIWNMILLYYFGGILEQTLGGRRLLQVYLLGGILGGLAHLGFTALFGVDPRLVGASAGVFAVLVYVACMIPYEVVTIIFVQVKMWFLAAVLVCVGAYMMMVSVRVGQLTGGVSDSGHLGGALFGYLAHRYGHTRSWRLPIVDRFQAYLSLRRQAAAQEKQRVLDELLDKVHREGLGSLTNAERKRLNKTSQELRGR